nr:MAG TPA: hypothetical protein [Caudoviricetes sp.]
MTDFSPLLRIMVSQYNSRSSTFLPIIYSTRTTI